MEILTSSTLDNFNMEKFANPTLLSSTKVLTSIETTGRASKEQTQSLFGQPLPSLFEGQLDLLGNKQLLDMPMGFDSLLQIMGPGEYVLEEPGDTSQPVIYEEVIDFFMDDGKVLISRSSAPIGTERSNPATKKSDASSIIALQEKRSLSIGLPSPSSSEIGCKRAVAIPKVSTMAIVKAPSTNSIMMSAEEKLADKREKNRLAAERCRARRVNLISALQAEVEVLKAEKELLLKQNKMLMQALSKSLPQVD